MIQPYIGAGIGVSVAQLRDINFQASSGAMTGKGSDVAFAYQFLAGLLAYVNKKVYLFGEYKYFGSSYNWKSEAASGSAGPTTSLTFHTHLVSLAWECLFKTDTLGGLATTLLASRATRRA